MSQWDIDVSLFFVSIYRSNVMKSHGALACPITCSKDVSICKNINLAQILLYINMEYYLDRGGILYGEY